MIEQSTLFAWRRRRTATAALMLASAAACLTSSPLLAQGVTAEDAEAQDPGLKAAARAEAPAREAPAKPSEAAAAMSAAAAGRTSAPATVPNSKTATVESAAKPFYGPPAPKAEGRKLSQVVWSEAPEEVPEALDRAITIVTRNYPSAKSARAALIAAASDVKAAKWLRFPRLTADIAYLEADEAPQPQVSVQVPIWSGGRIGAEIRRAKAEENVSSAGYVETVQTLALTTAQTYFEIVRLAQREQLLEESVSEHRRLIGTMERRVEQEVSPLADLELARSRTAQVEQEYTVTRAQRLTALRTLAELIADPSYDLGPMPPYDPVDLDSPATLEDQAATFDPRLRRLAAQVDVARANVDSTKASLLPQFDAQYSYDDIFKSRVGIVARAQTNGGLSQISEIGSARLRVQAALEDQRVAEQQLRRVVATDVIEYEAARKRASISTTASDTASRVSESYVRQFIAGRRSWLDVMNALREAVNAQIGKTDAETSAMAAAVRLLLRSGRWHPVFVDPAPQAAE